MKIARAAVDPHLQWRAGAACLGKAQMVVEAGGTGETFNYAVAVLLSPGNVDPSMLALVAAYPDVVAATTVEDEVPATDTVPDEAITDAVEAAWGTVSKKYPTNPLEA